MLTFVILTRLSPDAVRSPQALEQLEHKAMERIRQECPDVEWVSNYAVLGPRDYLDIFRMPEERSRGAARLLRFSCGALEALAHHQSH